MILEVFGRYSLISRAGA